MATTLTCKGQVTIPKPIRDALGLVPGSQIEFVIDARGQLVLQPPGSVGGAKTDRFAKARGKAHVRWRTNELMKLLRE